MFRTITFAAMTGALCLIACSVQARAEEPKKVAFVDTGNTGRSVMAEAIANAIIGRTDAKIAVVSRAIDIKPIEFYLEVVKQLEEYVPAALKKVVVK